MSTVVLIGSSCGSCFKIKNHNTFLIALVYIFPNVFAFLYRQKFSRSVEAPQIHMHLELIFVLRSRLLIDRTLSHKLYLGGSHPCMGYVLEEGLVTHWTKICR